MIEHCNGCPMLRIQPLIYKRLARQLRKNWVMVESTPLAEEAAWPGEFKGFLYGVAVVVTHDGYAIYGDILGKVLELAIHEELMRRRREICEDLRANLRD